MIHKTFLTAFRRLIGGEGDQLGSPSQGNKCVLVTSVHLKGIFSSKANKVHTNYIVLFACSARLPTYNITTYQWLTLMNTILTGVYSYKSSCISYVYTL